MPRTARSWRYLLAAVLALAMGFQNATLRRVDGHTLRTTYVSGVLTDFAEGAVDLLYWLAGKRSKPSASLGGLALLLGVWIGYFVGAVLGALAEERWKLFCLLVPILCLVLIAVVDVVYPFSRPAERTRSPVPG